MLFSCGLDVYYLIEPPINSTEVSIPQDPAQQFFYFQTRDSINTNTGIVGNINFLGTQIYYKIYDNEEILKSQKKSIDNVNNEYSDNGINKLNDLGFQKLESSNYSDPIIKKSTTSLNQTVEIWLLGNEAGIYIDSIKVGEPLRFDRSGNFKIEDEQNITGLDVNVTSTSQTDENSYYVLMYAVSVGTVNLSQRIYSSLLSLGYLEI